MARQNNVIPFVPKGNLEANKALEHFVFWAKTQIQLYDLPSDPFMWEAKSWHRWGINRSVCTKLGSKNELFHPDCIDFAKAMLFEEKVVKNKINSDILMALRCFEHALVETTGGGDVTKSRASVFDRACATAQSYYKGESSIYGVSRKLKAICDFMHSAGIVSIPFSWEPQVRVPKLTLEGDEENRKKKLPTDQILMALGEIFQNRPELPLDIMTTSAVALMLTQPCRVKEFNYLKKNCLFFEEDNQGRQQPYILWYSVKGFGASRKPIPDSMAWICLEAVNRVLEITHEAREYAGWLEDNPDLFPPHDQLPKKEIDDPLTLQEACGALMLSTEVRGPRAIFKQYLQTTLKSSRASEIARKIAQKLLDGYAPGEGTRIYENGKIVRYHFDDTWEITLRDLNVLVRDMYLPKYFPYTDERQITKWREALFCFKTGELVGESGISNLKPLGVVGCDSTRLSVQLSGRKNRTKSIFERYGYGSLKTNTHSFRHFLNTGAQRAKLSQELIARWSGRVDVGQNRVYNHMSSEEKAKEVEFFAPLFPVEERGPQFLETNKPINFQDLKRGDTNVVHFTEFGVCTHNYAQEPCAKFNNCLVCEEHVCIKGDETKLANLKDEREYIRSSLINFQADADDGAYGANSWLQTTIEKLRHCEHLIELLESPDIEDEALIRVDGNGWSAGRNALSMQEQLVKNEDKLVSASEMEDKAAELEQLLSFGAKHVAIEG